MFNSNIQAIVKLDKILVPISAIYFLNLVEYGLKKGDAMGISAFWCYDGKTYTRQVKQMANIMINVKDITYDKLKNLLDIYIRDVPSAKSDIQIIDKYKMFIPGYPIPYINK